MGEDVHIVVVGSSNTDMIVQVDRIPRPGETVLGGAFSMAAGGKGANQAVAAARAGGRVTFIARVGDDLFGRTAVEGFQADGIDVRYVVRDTETASGVALILVGADGQNSIAVAPGANARLSADDVDLARDAIRSASILLCQLEVPRGTVAAAVRLAAEAGVPVLLNPAPAQMLDDEMLRSVEILTPNETEAAQLAGLDPADSNDPEEAARRLQARGVRTVMVTLGSVGVLVASREGIERVPGFDVRAVDTTGAGDVFNGALAVALSQGRPTREAVRFASAAAAISVTRLGAQPSIPTRDEIEAFLALHE